VEQSLLASEQSGNLLDQALALGNLGNLTAYRGLTAQSIEHYRQVIEINERTGSRRALAIALNNMGLSLRDNAEYDQARRQLEQALDLSIELRDTFLQMMTLSNLGLVLSALGEWEAAEQHIRRSARLAYELGLIAEQLDRQVALGELALARGDLGAAIEEYQLGLPLVAETESEEYGRFQRLEAQIAFAQGEVARALELLRASESLFNRLQNVPEAERTKRVLAEVSAAADRVV
jgi:tetratricopeptide (TPR) repeat protein